MPLSSNAQERLYEFAEAAEGYALFGIMMNPLTGEIATYSSHGMKPGEVLGFLQRATQEMVTAASNNQLQYVGGEDGATGQTTEKPIGGRIELVH